MQKDKNLSVGLLIFILFMMCIGAISASASANAFLPVNSVTSVDQPYGQLSPSDAVNTVPKKGGALTTAYSSPSQLAVPVAATTAFEPIPTTTTTTIPTTKPTTKPQKLTITFNDANVRTDAGAGFPLVTVVHKDEKYTVLDQKKAENGVLWFLIDLGGGKSGYICCSYVSFDGAILGGRVYLTFDDGPSDNTRQILKILDEYNVKATFFVIHSPKYESVYKDIAKGGHTLALHSWSHDYAAIYKSEEAYFNDLNKLSDYVYSLTGVRSKIIRFPGGSSNTTSRKHCRGIMTKLVGSVTEKGYSYFDWNVCNGDAEGKEHVAPDKLISRVKRETGAKSDVIVLMHDAAVKDTTVKALPGIIEYYQSRGYAILPLTADSPQIHHAVNN